MGALTHNGIAAGFVSTAIEIVAGNFQIGLSNDEAAGMNFEKLSPDKGSAEIISEGHGRVRAGRRLFQFVAGRTCASE